MRSRIVNIFVLLAFVGLAHSNYTTIVNPATTYGTWQGWGCALSWWAAGPLGLRSDLSDLLFTTNNTVLNNVNLPGLGLNIARYNLGGSTWNKIGTASMVISPNIRTKGHIGALIEGYWLNWDSVDPSSNSWNWTADPNQRTALLNAKARGANIFQMFSCTPLWWMCDNHNPSGANSAGAENLQSWNHDQFAEYVASVASYARKNWNVDFHSVEAFNEPSANWWVSDGAQEGCTILPASQQSVISYLRKELDLRNLTSVKIAASDENSYTAAVKTWNSFSTATKDAVAVVDVHGYEHDGPRGTLYSDVGPKKPIWNSEYGESDATGQTMATNINADFTSLHHVAWNYWQPFDYSDWGLINIDKPPATTVRNANTKYFVLAQYSRHIRPGMTIISNNDHNTVVAHTGKTLVIITTNYGNAQWVTYELGKYQNVGGPITRWETRFDGALLYHQAQDTPLRSDKIFYASFVANSIQTFEIQDVY